MFNLKLKKMNTVYKEVIPTKLKNVIENCINNRIRIKVNLGDTETGKSWNEEHDTTGYIGRTTKGYPILIYNSRSHGGSLLMCENILKIQTTNGGQILYKVENFKPSVFEIRENNKLKGYSHSLFIDGIIYSNHKTLDSANKLKIKLS